MILETFDAPMLDYQNDNDFSMQVSSSDHWFQDEAEMEDDAHISGADVDVEVDMESYEAEVQDAHNPEYDMADDSRVHETIDIELYDASRVHSPDPLHGETNPLPTTEPEPTRRMPLPSDQLQPQDPSYVPFAEPHPYHASAMLEPTVSSDLTTSHHLEAVSEDDVPHIVVHEEEKQNPPSGLAYLGEGLLGPATPLSLESHTEEQPEEPSIDTHEAVGGGAEQVEADTSYQDALHEDGGAALPEEAHVEHLDQQNDDLQLEEEVVNVQSSTTSNGDPHEISEGIYIDPPPPVLLAFSANVSPVSLFNASLQLNPTSSDANDTTHDADLPVLLSHLPTLYYEPLSSVFSALRQDDYLVNVSDISHGELILDAHDLELVISEDHTYAHEITIHDLNILHDGLNKPGPLRLKLKTSVPRFIHRYHMLQEQVASALPELNQEGILESFGDEGVEQPEISPERHLETEGHHEHQEESHRDEEVHDQELDHDLHTEAPGAGDQTRGDDYPKGAADRDKTHDLGTESVSIGISPEDSVKAATPQPEITSSVSDLLEEHEYEAEEQIEPNTDDTDAGITPAQAELDHEPQVTIGNASADDHDGYADEDNATPQPTLAPALPPVIESTSSGTEQSGDYVDDGDYDEESSSSSAYFEDAHELHTLAGDLNEPVHGTSEDDNVPRPSTEKDHITTNLEATAEEFDLEAWDEELDGEGELDLELEGEQFEHETASTETSSTLSSKSSTKRTITEAELEDFEEHLSPSASPGSKRSRVE